MNADTRKPAWISKVVAAVIASVLSGCGDPIGKLINQQWPPVGIEEQRSKAIETAASTFDSLTAPNILVTVRLGDVQKAVLTQLDTAKAGLSDLKVTGNRQMLRLSAKFEHTFDAADAGDNESLAKWLATVRPQIAGTLEVYTGVTSALAEHDKEEPAVEVRLLPSLSSINVERVKLADKVDATAAAKMLVAVLNRYRDNISGELGRQPFMKVSIPAMAPEAIDPRRTMRLVQDGSTAEIVVTGNTIEVPVTLHGIGWLINDDQLTGLVQLVPKATEPLGEDSKNVALSETVKLEHSFEQLLGQIEVLVGEGFGVELIDANMVAVRKDIISYVLNSAVMQAQLCVAGSGQGYQQASSSKIRVPDGSAINCTPDRDCSPSGSCDFEPQVDRRDCSACILSRPKVCMFGGCVGGGCIQHGRDPVCALAQGAQNDLYRVDAAAKKFDCERLKSQKKLQCEVEKTGEKMLCEAGKETLNRLSATGNFANLDTKLRVDGAQVSVCLRNFVMSPAMDTLQVGADIGGSSRVAVDMKFTPLDILGHLTCQFPWTEEKTFKASVDKQRVAMQSSLALVTDGDRARVDFTTSEFSVSAVLSPSPTVFLLSSPNMTLACQGLNLLTPLAILLTPLVPELRGEIDVNVKQNNGSFEVALPSQSIGELNMIPRLRASPKALVLEMQLPPALAKGM